MLAYVPYAVIKPERTVSIVSWGSQSGLSFELSSEHAGGTAVEWTVGDVSAFTLQDLGSQFVLKCVSGLATGATGSAAYSVETSVVDEDFAIAMAELYGLVGAIQGGQSPPVSEDLDALLDSAVQAQGVPTDIDLWAARLARDIGNLAD